MTDTDNIMFEIFRVAGEPRDFRVIYFTELDEHDRDARINQALAGEHLFDGFIAERSAPQAKAAIADLIEQLKRGDELASQQIETILAAHLVN